MSVITPMTSVSSTPIPMPGVSTSAMLGVASATSVGSLPGTLGAGSIPVPLVSPFLPVPPAAPAGQPQPLNVVGGVSALTTTTTPFVPPTSLPLVGADVGGVSGVSGVSSTMPGAVSSATAPPSMSGYVYGRGFQGGVVGGAGSNFPFAPNNVQPTPGAAGSVVLPSATVGAPAADVALATTTTTAASATATNAATSATAATTTVVGRHGAGACVGALRARTGRRCFSTAAPSGMAVAMAMGEPLAGVKVVDLSRLLPGPYCTQLLADMGAAVIKVEDYKSGGDGTRLYPPHTADGGSAMYHVLNRGKKSVGVHLRSEEGVSAIRRLIEGDGTPEHPPADVLVESFRPGILEKMMGVEVTHEVRCAKCGVWSVECSNQFTRPAHQPTTSTSNSTTASPHPTSNHPPRRVTIF